MDGKLNFELKNIGHDTFFTTPLTTNFNRIIIKDETENVYEVYVWKDMIPMEIAPLQTKNWNADIKVLLTIYDLWGQEIELHWEVNNEKSDKIYINLSKD